MTVLVVGAGPIGRAHATALRVNGVDDVVVWGYSERNKGAAMALGLPFAHGSLSTVPNRFDVEAAIVATPVELLAETSLLLMQQGVSRLLIEKPGALDVVHARELALASMQSSCQVFVAFNRRFFGSVSSGLDWITKESSGISSGFFDFSETQDVLRRLQSRPAAVRERWLVANSLHVIDAAFLPTGLPDRLSPVPPRVGTADSDARVFVGTATTPSGVAFSYHANWGSGSRWRIEWHTPQGSVSLLPLEQAWLSTSESPFERQLIGEAVAPAGLKLGLVEQARAFLGGEGSDRLFPVSDLPQLIELADVLGSGIGRSFDS